MNMTDIKAKAKELGVQIGKLGKEDLIKAIQTKEGNFPCFGTAKEYCSEKLCAWREACLPAKKSSKGWEKKKQEYSKKMTTELDKLKKQLADLEAKATKLVGAGKKEAQDEIAKLKEMMATVKAKSQKLSAAGDDAWEIAKKGIDEAWKDLSKAFKKAVKKFK